jgi:hypothetical protein
MAHQDLVLHPITFERPEIQAPFIKNVVEALDLRLKDSQGNSTDNIYSYLTDTWSDTDKVGLKPPVIISNLIKT